MKWRQLIRITEKSIKKQFFSKLLMLVLLTFLFFMTELMTALAMGPFIGRLSAEWRTGKKFSQMGSLDIGIDEEWDEGVYLFLRELCSSGIIDGISGYSLCQWEDTALKPLIEIQNHTGIKKREVYYSDNALLAFIADDLSLFADDCELEEELMKQSYPGITFFAVLGDCYREIPIGTVIQSDIASDWRYIVIGYLPRHYCFFRDNVLLNASLETTMDEMVIFLEKWDEPHIRCQRQVFYRKAGITDETLSQIQRKADEKGIEISLLRLDTAYQRNTLRAGKESAYAMPYLIVIFLSVAVIVISYHLLQIIGNSRKYGGYYALGFEGRDIRRGLLLENAIWLLLAMTASMTVFTAGVFQIEQEVPVTGGVLSEGSQILLIGAAFAVTLFTALLLLFVATETPWLLLKRKSPAELLRNPRN